MTGKDVVQTETSGAVAVVRVDHPPVNALSRQVRAGFLDAVRAAEADPAVAAIVLICAGRTFIAGADISEFDKPPEPPLLPEVIAAIAGARKPVVAAIHGTALGGGFEVALAVRHRVALASAKVGLPEIRLGLIPGAGGTQRLPRLVGVGPALAMMLSGAPVEAAAAREMGAIDRVIEGDDLHAGALAFAAEILAQGAPPRPAAGQEGLGDDDRAVIAALRAEHAAAEGGQIARRHLIDAVETGLAQGFDAGLAAERASFLMLRASPEAKALREAFFAARRRKSEA